MKLLLTSAGIRNESLKKALFELVGKTPEQTKLAFIPTASNVEVGDKGWLIEDLVSLQQCGFAEIDIADISALEPDLLRTKLENADVLYFEGGNTYHLMRWIEKSGLTKMLPELLENKVYVGVSAGSIIVSKDLALRMSQELFEEDLDEKQDIPGLHLVDYYVVPHLNSVWFPKLRKENIAQATSGMTETMYVLDDQSALKVVDGNMEVISEGEWYIINE
ncbi:MAG: hypothetical protein COV59_03215 [Candidatus Magasanikbacteria bacterium CG11_big_fil_rev_8_21_14_0_20_39_34]|uniref:Peptidase S51 n=1 Tax=Candidatus Magasanikbacteria bacterium CG11_big_fil_rev_8_21_14_0_20_39_34 TaxID=1974653 RepID=A0A2H0N5J1_9BACT|nr:MAG: hypothetical protein COV59_03215 [Candidatus Magasanikbacteria bacterium CG11_big_fil_rev_8_21_14_0_20_39_34]